MLEPQFVEVINVRVFLDKLLSGVADQNIQLFILKNLDERKKKAVKNRLDFPFILIPKNSIKQNKIIPYRNTVIVDWSKVYGEERFQSVFAETISRFELLYEYDYINGITHKLSFVYFFRELISEEEYSEEEYRYVCELSSLFEKYDIYLLKDDINAIESDILFSDDEIFLMYDNRFITGSNWREDNSLNELIDEWNNSEAQDLAFDLWEKDKAGFTRTLEALNKGLEIQSPPQKNNRISKLETQLAISQAETQKLNQSAVKNESVFVEEKYNPTERETHLLMINALVNIITRPNFKAGAAKYLKANGINQSAIYGEITEEITRILNAPETKERSEETIKRRLKEAVGLETQQAG